MISSFNFRDCFGVIVTVTVEVEEVVDIMALVVLAKICQPSNYKANSWLLLFVCFFYFKGWKRELFLNLSLNRLWLPKIWNKLFPSLSQVGPFLSTLAGFSSSYCSWKIASYFPHFIYLRLEELLFINVMISSLHLNHKTFLYLWTIATVFLSCLPSLPKP